MIAMAMATIASGAAKAELEARVCRSAAGVPQIFVNGKPVPPRMFWGTEGCAPFAVDGEWKDFRYEFTAFGDDPGTVHIRFLGGRTGRVEFRNVHVTDIESGEEFAETWKAFPRKYADSFRFADGVLTIEEMQESWSPEE